MSILIILNCNANIKNIQTQKQRIFTNEHDDTQNTQNIKDESYDAQNKQTEETSKVKTYKAHKIIGVIGLLLCGGATILIVKNHATESNSLKTKMQDLFTKRHTKQINEYITNFEIIKDIGTKLGIKDIDTLKNKDNTEINDLLVTVYIIKNIIHFMSYDYSVFKDDINKINNMEINGKIRSTSISNAINKDDILYKDLYYLYDRNDINVSDLDNINIAARFLNITEPNIDNKPLYKDVETVYQAICKKVSEANLNHHKTLFDYDLIAIIRNSDDNPSTISITEWEANNDNINSMCYIANRSEYFLLDYITNYYETIHLSTFIIDKSNNKITIKNRNGDTHRFLIHSSIFDDLIKILEEYKLKVSYK